MITRGLVQLRSRITPAEYPSRQILGLFSSRVPMSDDADDVRAVQLRCGHVSLAQSEEAEKSRMIDIRSNSAGSLGKPGVQSTRLCFDCFGHVLFSCTRHATVQQQQTCSEAVKKPTSSYPLNTSAAPSLWNSMRAPLSAKQRRRERCKKKERKRG